MPTGYSFLCIIGTTTKQVQPDRLALRVNTIPWLPDKMNEHEKINYIEFPARDLEQTKTFFSSVFGWSFTDFGPEYTAFSNAGIDGGFYKSDLRASTEKGGALIVFFSFNLEETKSKIELNGGSIIKPIFSFPGGRRFHFNDPNGNEYAVWSDQ